MTGPSHRAPLSAGQSRLFFSELLRPDSGGYVIQRAVRLIGDLDVPALQTSMQLLVGRHEILRTIYSDDGPYPEQIVGPASLGNEFALELTDLGDRADDSAEAVNSWIAAARGRSFDLRAEPPLRTGLARLGADDHVLLITVHHIAMDGWSMSVLLGELATAYAALIRGEEPALPPARAYRDYVHAEQARADEMAEHERFWRTQLAGAGVPGPGLLEYPAEWRRTDEALCAAFNLPAELPARIAELSRRQRCTPFMTVLAVWSGLLTTDSGAAEITVATASSGRWRPEDHGLVGFLVNVVPIRIACTSELSLTQLLARVRDACLTASEHNELPYERIVAASRAPRLPNRPALAQVLFDLHPRAAVPTLPGLRCSEWPIMPRTLRFELELHVTYDRSAADGILLAAADLFEPDTVQRHRDAFVDLLNRWTAEPERALADLIPIRSVSEGT
ncbi:condensation domain-containing protein [Solwaraspora sp. WMMD792]|uniref:condensation domain-containing protein n=1 Tax=Solwaraspora sp. WMMD792 TaxID=3016099 RepID=UPI00241675FC|nr:condensation domain-containing protein [Solwaraspora sp. WMMD792]MDG4773082.1 condensation domain-containing protein [Solwaraspora sp. WMMD792]